jgi:CheY-like chemotaxis protein
VAADLTDVPEDHKVMLRLAVNRISEIANGLLEKRKVSDGSRQAHLLFDLAALLVSEKQVQHRSNDRIHIDIHASPGAHAAFAQVDPADFKRVLSNLIDNGVEAIAGSGSVTVRLGVSESRVLVDVKDTGRGMSAAALANAGRPGVSVGKPGGHGLGLSHAFSCAKSWGGQVKIATRPGEGTTVTVELPRERTPEWLPASLRLRPKQTVLILDDDPSVHELWKLRLREVPAGLNVLHASDEATLRACLEQVPRGSSMTCLFDLDLGQGARDGLTLAGELGLTDRTIIVTSRYGEDEIRRACIAQGVRLLPKSLVGFIGVELEKEIRQGAIDELTAR